MRLGPGSVSILVVVEEKSIFNYKPFLLDESSLGKFVLFIPSSKRHFANNSCLCHKCHRLLSILINHQPKRESSRRWAPAFIE